MKQINGLNMMPISRDYLTEALQGEYVAMVGLIHIPWDDNMVDPMASRLRTLENQIEDYVRAGCDYTQSDIFRKTSQGYRRGKSSHYWQKGDYCLTYLGLYVVVTGHVIMVLKAV